MIASRQLPGQDGWEDVPFSTGYSNPKTDFILPELSPKHFSFNSLSGACPACQGFGSELFFDPDLVIPDPKKSLLDGAIAPWRKATKRIQAFRHALLTALARKYQADPETPPAPRGPDEAQGVRPAEDAPRGRPGGRRGLLTWLLGWWV